MTYLAVTHALRTFRRGAIASNVLKEAEIVFPERLLIFLSSQTRPACLRRSWASPPCNRPRNDAPTCHAQEQSEKLLTWAQRPSQGHN